MTSRKRKNKKSKIIPENKRVRERAKFSRGRKRKLKKTKVLRLNKINGSNLV
jgi:hypothetical protein